LRHNRGSWHENKAKADAHHNGLGEKELQLSVAETEHHHTKDADDGADAKQETQMTTIPDWPVNMVVR